MIYEKTRKAVRMAGKNIIRLLINIIRDLEVFKI